MDYVLFLETLISISSHTGSSMGSIHQRLRAVGQLRLLAPIERIQKKLVAANFLSAKYKSGTPKFIG
jgi:hypothetical protein